MNFLNHALFILSLNVIEIDGGSYQVSEGRNITLHCPEVDTGILCNDCTQEQSTMIYAFWELMGGSLASLLKAGEDLSVDYYGRFRDNVELLENGDLYIENAQDVLQGNYRCKIHLMYNKADVLKVKQSDTVCLKVITAHSGQHGSFTCDDTASPTTTEAPERLVQQIIAKLGENITLSCLDPHLARIVHFPVGARMNLSYASWKLKADSNSYVLKANEDTPPEYGGLFKGSTRLLDTGELLIIKITEEFAGLYSGQVTTIYKNADFNEKSDICLSVRSNRDPQEVLEGACEPDQHLLPAVLGPKRITYIAIGTGTAVLLVSIVSVVLVMYFHKRNSRRPLTDNITYGQGAPSPSVKKSNAVSPQLINQLLQNSRNNMPLPQTPEPV